MNSRSHYDVVIIGAGMSGLAAGIRLAHFGLKVCIFERHNAPGGLNGFYSIAGRKYDVGLHAMTNFVRAGVRGTPLGKLLRQLRIDREEFALCEQRVSRISFGAAGQTNLRFSNDFSLLESEVASVFPAQIDGFRKLVAAVRSYDDVSLDAAPVSARSVVRSFVNDPLLEDMLFCPVMYYGSPQEHDMDFGQFVIMFKALFLEGFARPFEGVRLILRVLLAKYREAGGERRMRCGVRSIRAEAGRATELVLDSGESVTATHVLSSIGSAETQRLWTPAPKSADSVAVAGRSLSYVETISVLDRQPSDLGWADDTIVFFNDSHRFTYERPQGLVDTRSGVICFPNNFQYAPGEVMPEGWLRCTCLAAYPAWAALDKVAYAEAKARHFDLIQASALRFLPGSVSPELLRPAIKATDMFTPLTITRFTGHDEGAIYGAPLKNRQGRTELANVYLCGTDQGFLGIIGAMLSGISMANFHVLQPGVRA